MSPQSVLKKFTNRLSNRLSWAGQFWQQCVVIKLLNGGYNFSPEVRIVVDSFNGLSILQSHTSFVCILPCTLGFGSSNCGLALGQAYHLRVLRVSFEFDASSMLLVSLVE